MLQHWLKEFYDLGKGGGGLPCCNNDTDSRWQGFKTPQTPELRASGGFTRSSGSPKILSGKNPDVQEVSMVQCSDGHMCVCVHVCIRVYISVYTFKCCCVHLREDAGTHTYHIPIHKWTEGQMDRAALTDRRTDRQTDRLRTRIEERERERHTHTHIHVHIYYMRE